jgi:hypothetical protein
MIPPGVDILKMQGGRVPAQTMTDETAILYLAFLGHLLCTSFASQLPEIVKPDCPTVTARHAPSRAW